MEAPFMSPIRSSYLIPLTHTNMWDVPCISGHTQDVTFVSCNCVAKQGRSIIRAKDVKAELSN